MYAMKERTYDRVGEREWKKDKKSRKNNLPETIMFCRFK